MEGSANNGKELRGHTGMKDVFMFAFGKLKSLDVLSFSIATFLLHGISLVQGDFIASLTRFVEVFTNLEALAHFAQFHIDSERLGHLPISAHFTASHRNSAGLDPEISLFQLSTTTPLPPPPPDSGPFI